MHAFPLLSRMVSAEMFMRLCTLMPPPLDDTQEASLARDLIGLNAILNLGPIRTTEEAMLAIIIIAADLHTHDGFRLAVENGGNLKSVLQCRAQALSMMRERRRAAERLERMQARHREEQPAAAAETAEAEAAPVPEAVSVVELEVPVEPPVSQPDPVASVPDPVGPAGRVTPRFQAPEYNGYRYQGVSPGVMPAAIAMRLLRPEPVLSAW